MNRPNAGTQRRPVSPAALAVVLTVVGFVNLTETSASAQRRTTTHRAAARKPVTKYARGYSAGYSAGYTSGKSDWQQQGPADYQRSGAFARREGTPDPQLNSSEDYKQGYDLGFQIAYLDGYYGRLRNAAIPTNAAVLGERLAVQQAAQARAQAEAQARDQGQQNQGQNQPDAQRGDPQQQVGDPQGDSRDRRRYSATAVDIPNDTELRLKLTSPIDTRTSHIGDAFTAEVIMPAEYEGATVEGHLQNLKKSGRVSGKTEVSLSFDNIVLRDGRRGRISAQLVKLFESESVRKVDEEGKIESGDRTRDSEIRGGVGAAVGAIIGGIAGGGRGAVVGILLGGAAGVGTVYVEGDKDLILDRGTEMVIRTARSRKGSN